MVLTELNSVTDNPNVFPDEDLILSGGNFHAQPLAFAARLSRSRFIGVWKYC